jgi:hypothetical protein
LAARRTSPIAVAAFYERQTKTSHAKGKSMPHRDLPMPEIKTFEVPPSDFEPLAASEEELLKYGFPSRPAEGPHRERYDRVLSSLKGKLEIVKPELEYHPDRFHGPRRTPEGADTAISHNWSGGVVSAPAGDAFVWIQGEWVVPNVSAPTADEWYYCASWVGIDGDGSDDVCQSGVECEIYRPSSGAPTVNIYPWVEWYPAGEIAITNLAVHPGDLVTVLICTNGHGSTSASVFFSNRTSGQSTSLALNAPAGISLVGNCAEWIVEAPTVGGAQSSLANYGETVFTDSDAWTHGGKTVGGGTGESIDMVDSNGKVVSDGILLAATAVECEYV